MSDKDTNEIVERLDEIIFWLRFTHLQEAQKYFELILNSERKKDVYQLTDGTHSINQIMEKLGIKSKSQIPDWYAEWTTKGILRESETNGKKIRLVDLKELGLYE